MFNVALRKTPNNHSAWPIADEALTQKILDMIQQASHNKQLKKGANEGKFEPANMRFAICTDEPSSPPM